MMKKYVFLKNQMNQIKILMKFILFKLRFHYKNKTLIINKVKTKVNNHLKIQIFNKNYLIHKKWILLKQEIISINLTKQVNQPFFIYIFNKNN